MISLDEYLSGAMARPWRWGTMDCVCFAVEWAAAVTGRDALQPLRGKWTDAASARRFIRRGGGLLRLMTEGLAAAGYTVTESPEHGDIALVKMQGPESWCVAGATAVICNGPWWIGRDLNGIVGFSASPLIAWKVAA